MGFRGTALATILASAATMMVACKDEPTPAAKGGTEVRWVSPGSAPVDPPTGNGAVAKDPKDTGRIAADVSSAAPAVVNTASKGPKEPGVGVALPPPAANSTTVARGAAADARPKPSARNSQTDMRPQAAAARRRGAPPTGGTQTRAEVGMFFNDLGQHGNWVRHPDFSYVWLPTRQGAGWRPYQEGRWIWTDAYGWYWESAEPFAWAVYHYGRWSYEPDYGWFWIPGDTWAPAWVSFRHGGGRIGWAAIAPDRKGYAQGVPRRFLPSVAEAWVFVDERRFASSDLVRHVLPIRQIGAVLALATEVASRAIAREQIERLSARQVEVREVVHVETSVDIFEDVRHARIGIYRPIIDDLDIHEPPREVISDVTRIHRIEIREHTETRISGVPSAALLDVLDEQERRILQEERLSQQEAAAEQRIETLQQDRQVLLDERRREAERLHDDIEREQQEAARRRALEQQRRLDERRHPAGDDDDDAGVAGARTDDADNDSHTRPVHDRAAAGDWVAAPPPASSNDEPQHDEDTQSTEE
jgi:hypothetical protein